jgi:glutamate/tyrosine decarboxylase-like PLP-dependent enzyme
MDKAAFLGPKAENAAEFENLLLEVLRDHVFWRRNFHPSDPRLISERDKATEEYREFVARLRDELFQILSELKRGAPIYSPRQVAHMVTDPSLPALVGYFSGMLYNQNNVVAEVSPETVKKERDYLAALARMVGYPVMLPPRLPRGEDRSFSWGHLTGGGTIANLEAMWVVRNLRFFPASIRLLAATDENMRELDGIVVTTPSGGRRSLNSLSSYDLMMLDPAEVCRLRGVIAPSVLDRLPTVGRLGMAGFLAAFNAAFPDDQLVPPRILVSQAAHYGWRKIADMLGIGAANLVELPVDRHFRLNIESLRSAFSEAREQRIPVLAIVSICGTTEEGSIDPLHRSTECQEDWSREGASVWHHSDAAMGGFFAAMVHRDEKGTAADYDHAPDHILSRDVYNGIIALSQADSITIDPHKFGYVPYPSGAILFREYRTRDFIAYPAPYLAADPQAGFGGFIGQWTVEGSRPGAAAVSCYLAQAVMPLEPEGHGRLVRQCVVINKSIAEQLLERFADDDSSLRIYPIAEPDTTEFCFFVAPRGRRLSLDQLNELNLRIWRNTRVDGREPITQYDFLVSKTSLDIDRYHQVIDPILRMAHVDHADVPEGTELTLLRLCCMNPLLSSWNDREITFSAQLAERLLAIARWAYDGMHQSGSYSEEQLLAEI